MILILSNKWDVTVDFVVKDLQRRGYPYARLNTEDFPRIEVTTKLPDLSVTVEKGNERIDLVNEVGAIWYRRPGKPFEFTDDEETPDEATLEYIREQWRAYLRSFQTVESISWVNHPDKNQQMESKIHQLRLAHEIGFSIPDTVVTNSGGEVSRMFEKQDESMISKALSAPLVENTENDEFVFSVHLEEQPSETDPSLNICPTIFQEPILPKTDYRVTVVGEQVFAVRVEGEEGVDIPVDWRTKKDEIRFVETDLPVRVEDLCREYVNQAGLVFGAIDLVESDGEYVFLEINPNGEWGWLQKPWGIPIAESLTEELIERDKIQSAN